MTPSTPAGWYQGEGDPPGSVRWWDGEKWADEYVMQGQQDAGGAVSSNAGTRGALASWGSRFAARLIDSLVIIAMFIPIVIIAAIIGQISGGLGALVAIVGYLAVLVAAIYVIWWAQGTTGQSPGKRVMGIEVIDDATGQYIGGGKAIGRWLLDFVNGLPLYLGYLWPLWDNKSQTFSDKILGTVVVQTDRPKNLFPLFPDGKPF